MKRMGFAALLVPFCIAAGFAQSQMSSGDVKGTVGDLHGGIIRETTVLLTNSETGSQKKVVSDTSGSWHLFIVPPGVYELQVEQPGFVTLTRRPVHVTVGETVNIDLRL